ncbi:hypothetical protein [Aurantiacibacter suaedae]|uniref:hypothetical protein n=1 Tax=Aurantiacibacter suaedae TaxID=2545755 RepID=UPI0010F53330|nr:hypothetical protein [Aurantiacibacter suaedae]
MIEFVPYLLVLIGWQSADVAGSMTAAQSLHPSEMACESAGAQALAESDGTYRRYFCLLAPTQQDIEDLWQEQKP